MAEDVRPAKGAPPVNNSETASGRFTAITFLKRAMPLSRQARVAASLVPARMQFRFAAAAGRWQGRLAGALGGNRRLTELAMREHWLRELAYHDRLPVPVRVHGQDALDRYSATGPVLYYTAHLAMSDVPLRVLIEQGYPIPVPIADEGRIVDGGCYPVVGMQMPIPALCAGPSVLLRARTLLKEGRSIACMADRDLLDDQLNGNPLRLAGRMRVPVVLMWAELAEDGVVDVTFRAAPHPWCENEAAIDENIGLIREIPEQSSERAGHGASCNRVCTSETRGCGGGSCSRVCGVARPLPGASAILFGRSGAGVGRWSWLLERDVGE